VTLSIGYCVFEAIKDANKQKQSTFFERKILSAQGKLI